MRDDDRLLDLPAAEFGSGVIGICDICGTRQAVVILTKERFRLCVLDFLNKSWIKTDRKPGAPAPLYRSERITFETGALGGRPAPAIALTPAKIVRHPAVLITPDIYGITTTVLDAAIRFAREGFEVLVPDLGKTEGVGLPQHLALRGGTALRGGVPVGSSQVRSLLALYGDAFRHLLAREMVDPARAAVFGASYGGSLAVALAAQNTRLGAVALAYPLPVRPREVAGLITAPVLVVHGTRDPTAARAAHELGETLGAHPPTIVRLPGARHHFLARDLRAYSLPRAEEAWDGVLRFLKQQLMPPPPRPPAPPVRVVAGPSGAPPAVTAAGAPATPARSTPTAPGAPGRSPG